MNGVDLTGIWASGKIFSGNANSKGLEHWFETETFSLDYSLITPNKKMVKACYANTKWNQEEYEAYILDSKQKLELMNKTPINIKPGEYRTYIAPAGVSDLIEIAVAKGKKQNKKIKLGICGEHGGDPSSVRFCNKIGLDYVSCSPYRIPIAKLAAAQAVIDDISK